MKTCSMISFDLAMRRLFRNEADILILERVSYGVSKKTSKEIFSDKKKFIATILYQQITKRY